MLRGTVKFFPILESSSSPKSTGNHVYLSIKHTSSSGILTETRRLRQIPSLDVAGLPLCSALKRPWGRCGGRSDPNISVMYFLSVECMERVGLISQMGRCAAVFSLTKIQTPLSALLRTATKSLRSNLLWGLIAGNWKYQIKVSFWKT